MNIIFVCRCCNNVVSGVNKKILSQVESLNNLGAHTIIHSICTREKEPISKHIRLININEFNNSESIMYKIIREYEINKKFSNIVHNLFDQDIVYLRSPYPSFYLYLILKRTRRCKIVIEYQTIEFLEYTLIKKYWYLILDFFFGNAIRKYTDAIVGVTDEITSYQLSRTGNPNKPHITIGNGFDVATAPVRQPPGFDGTELHLLCIAQISIWHGIDRLLKGMANYQGNTKIILHIAGKGPQQSHLEEIALKLNISDRIIYYGFINGKKLDTLFDTCHIGIGSLGIHRSGLQEATTLKAREYCSKGIPFIYGVYDPDFPLDFPYILKVPSDESPVDMKNIISFAERVCTSHDTPQKMHSYAEKHLDWSKKMEKLKSFLEKLGEHKKSIDKE